jgi:hypothetical protein
MIKEIFEVTLFDGISIDEVRTTVSQFPDSFVEQSRTNADRGIVTIECPANTGRLLRKSIEQLRQRSGEFVQAAG